MTAISLTSRLQDVSKKCLIFGSRKYFCYFRIYIITIIEICLRIFFLNLAWLQWLVYWILTWTLKRASGYMSTYLIKTLYSFSLTFWPLQITIGFICALQLNTAETVQTGIYQPYVLLQTNLMWVQMSHLISFSFLSDPVHIHVILCTFVLQLIWMTYYLNHSRYSSHINVPEKCTGGGFLYLIWTQNVETTDTSHFWKNKNSRPSASRRWLFTLILQARLDPQQ